MRKKSARNYKPKVPDAEIPAPLVRKALAQLEETETGTRSCRRERRLPLRLVGLIVFSDLVFKCNIRNESTSGLNIILPNEDFILPNSFELVIPALAVIYQAEIAWRKGASLGVRIKMPLQMNDPDNEALWHQLTQQLERMATPF